VTVPDRRDPRPRARVVDMARSLDFYLGLGCEVGRASDGWVLLSCGPVAFVLVRSAEPDDASGGAPWIHLTTPDVRALRRRLQHDGVPAGVLLRPAHAPSGEIVVLDPDRRPVAIRQQPPGRRTGGVTVCAGTVDDVAPDPR
jgi:catechol 2,3-dioxygenase-like lactoylglutathione lyase family enzyme